MKKYPKYDDDDIVVIPKGVTEGDEFISEKGLKVKCPKGVSEGDRISVAKVVAVETIGNCTETSARTKSLFFRHRCMCFGQDFKVFNDRKEKQYMFKGALKILGQIDLSMSEVKTGEEVCTVKRGTNVFTSGRVKIKSRDRTFATVSISTIFGLSIGISLATHGSLRIVGDVKKRTYRILGPKSITGNEHILKVTMSDRMEGMIEVQVSRDDLCAPLWVACCVAIEKCVADWERRNNPKDNDIFST